MESLFKGTNSKVYQFNLLLSISKLKIWINYYFYYYYYYQTNKFTDLWNSIVITTKSCYLF